jgi:AraC-like DNA-binding protein
MLMYQWPEDAVQSKPAPQIGCIINGHSDFRVGNYTLHVPAGHFIIVPPGIPHPDGSRGHMEGKGTCDILWLTLWSDVFRCWICHSINQEHLPMEPTEACFVKDASAGSFFLALAEEASEREAQYQQVCESLHLAMWTVIQRRIGEGRFQQDIRLNSPEDGLQRQIDDPIALAQEYVRSHLQDHLTLASVAQRVYLSRAQFARRFHAETGQTFNDFINQCRVEEASRLLTETEWSLAIISEFTGVTREHMRSVFLKRTGQTPLEFRLSQRTLIRQQQSKST